jgi:hypothetical protein
MSQRGEKLPHLPVGVDAHLEFALVGQAQIERGGPGDDGGAGFHLGQDVLRDHAAVLFIPHRRQHHAAAEQGVRFRQHLHRSHGRGHAAAAFPVVEAAPVDRTSVPARLRGSGGGRSLQDCTEPAMNSQISRSPGAPGASVGFTESIWTS